MNRSRVLLVLVSAAGLAQGTRAQITSQGVQFVDRTLTGEITLGNYRGATAVLDFDLDGFMDLAVGDVSSLFPVRLFRNVADAARPGRRTFMDVTAGAGLDDADARSRAGGGGIVSADFDNDGYPDIFLVGHVSSTNDSGLLFRNNGDGTFTNVSIAAGVRTPAGERAEAAAWVDFDLDGWTDLFVAAGGTTAHTMRLYRNNKDGTFNDATAALPSITGVGVIYSMLWTDLEDDGYSDAVILTTSPAPTILHNDAGTGGQRVFREVAIATGFTELGPAPMGIAAGDFDGDGDRDLAITNAQLGVYYRNDAGHLTKFTPFGTFFGWGVLWIDADNDGRLDNYQAGSYARSANADRLIRNLGNNQWSDVSPALNGGVFASQYAVQIDLDNDGRQDIITVNPGVPGQFISVYENNSPPANHWLKVALRGDGTRSNRDAIGAVVRVHSGGLAGATQTAEIINGSSTTATEDLRPNFGLGAATAVDWIEVVWPRRGTLARRTERYIGPFAADQTLALAPHCESDFNRDGFVTGDDFDALVDLFVAGDLDADFDTDGFVTGDDFDAFAAAFESGC